jgi:hypothetical protein
MADQDTRDVDRGLASALEKARQDAPEQDPSLATFGRDIDDLDEQAAPTSAEDATAQDWIVADAARPDFADETVDGLDEIEEEVRHAAEDLDADEPFEELVRRKAHELWLSEGGPHGRDKDHWRIASELVAEEIRGSRTDLPYVGETEGRVEEARVQENLGEFPDLDDQGGEDVTKP